MNRPKLVVLHPEQEQSRGGRDGKKYRFELSRKKVLFFASSFVVVLCWMFFLGVLVGRGVALVSAEDVSIRAEIMRFLGLEKQDATPVQRAAETWADPRKMLESLNYYEDLTQKSVTSAAPKAPAQEAKPAQQETVPPVAAADPTREVSKEASKEAKETASKRSAAQHQQQAPAPVQEKEPEKVAKSAPGAFPSEQYTLLVASLKDPENAQKLVEKLKGKGYTPRLEAIDLNGGGRWNRVLVGSFQSREAALKFATDFNRKENLEGLVIREPN